MIADNFLGGGWVGIFFGGGGGWGRGMRRGGVSSYRIEIKRLLTNEL